MPPPRYYDSQYELVNPIDMERIKRYRIERANKKEMLWSDDIRAMGPQGKVIIQASLREEDAYSDRRLRVMEEVKHAQLRMCKRIVESA